MVLENHADGSVQEKSRDKTSDIAHVLLPQTSDVEDLQLLKWLVEGLPERKIYLYVNHPDMETTLACWGLAGKEANLVSMSGALSVSRKHWQKSLASAESKIKLLREHCPHLFMFKGASSLALERVFTRVFFLRGTGQELALINDFQNIQVESDADTHRIVVITQYLTVEEIQAEFDASRFKPDNIEVILFPLKSGEYAESLDTEKTDAFQEALKQYQNCPLLDKQGSKEQARGWNLFQLLFRHPRKNLLKYWEEQFVAKFEIFKSKFYKPQSVQHEVLVFIKVNHHISHELRLLRPLIKNLLENNIQTHLVLVGQGSLSWRSRGKLKKEVKKAIKNHAAFSYSIVDTPVGLKSRYKRLATRVYDDPALDAYTRLLLRNLVIRFRKTQSAFLSLSNFINRYEFNHLIGNLGSIHDLSLIAACKKMQAENATISAIQFGLLLDNCQYNYFELDHLFLYDKATQAMVETSGCSAKGVHAVGNLEWEFDETNGRPLSDKVLSLVKNSAFVVGMFNQPLLTSRQIDKRDILSTYQMLLDLVDQCEDACVLFKPHHRDKMELLEAYLPKHPRIVLLPVDTANAQLWKYLDVAVSFYSAVLHTAIAKGIPSISIHGVDHIETYYQFIVEQGGLRTKSKDEALTWMLRYHQDEVFRTEIQARVSAFKQQASQYPASHRIIDTLLRRETIAAPDSVTASALMT